MYKILALCLIAFTSLHSLELRLARCIKDIDCKKAEELLVKSFMHGYEDVPLIKLNPGFQSIGDVRRFYENYFKEELSHFQKGSLLWVQAFSDQELVGWATFELEPGDRSAAYMNLLAVLPEKQHLGIGKALVFSIRSSDLFPEVNTISLLIRKINLRGLEFYKKIGFLPCDYQRDNFVDTSLLTGLRWSLNQSEQSDNH